MSSAPTGLALLYSRVSTSMQVNDGISLNVQEKTLKQAATHAGYTLQELLREEGKSGKSITGRPVLSSALKRLESKEAAALFVTRIDRLSRSTRDFLMIVDHAQRHDWRLVLLDLNLDTSSYSSRFVVTIMSALAEMERGIISARQKDVHKYRRDIGQVWGVDTGPKKVHHAEVELRIRQERASGLSFQKIADGLNKDGIQTVRGNKWYSTSVKYIVDRT